MESKGGGCCVTRCANGAYDMSKVERIMLKFRPIAPKPLAGAAVSDGSSSESGDAFIRSAAGANRKRAKVTNRCNRRRRKTTPSPSPLSAPVVTLPLLPETPDPKDPPAAKRENSPAWLNFENLGHVFPAVDRPASVGAVVTVECVTDRWRYERLGSAGEEMMREQLREDTCPGFISDGFGRVTWTNGAFRETVGEGMVWLVAKDEVPYGGFTCRVRLQREKRSDLTVPCDVWRIMDGGGFAWRLDVNAALTLSLAL